MKNWSYISILVSIFNSSAIKFNAPLKSYLDNVIFPNPNNLLSSC